MSDNKIKFIRNPIEVIDEIEEPDICDGVIVSRYINPAIFCPKYVVEYEGMKYYIMYSYFINGWGVVCDGGVFDKSKYYHNSGNNPEKEWKKGGWIKNL